jgi:hypothetical protein
LTNRKTGYQTQALKAIKVTMQIAKTRPMPYFTLQLVLIFPVLVLFYLLVTYLFSLSTQRKIVKNTLQLTTGLTAVKQERVK